MGGSTNNYKLLKVKLIDISPYLKISFFLVRERIFFTNIVFFLNDFFFSWTLSWSRASSFVLGQVLVFMFSYFFFSFLNSKINVYHWFDRIWLVRCSIVLETYSSRYPPVNKNIKVVLLFKVFEPAYRDAPGCPGQYPG